MSRVSIIQSRLRSLEATAQSTRKSIQVQNQWIEQCGGNLSGYVRTYGVKGHPTCKGDGAHAIFAADMTELARLIDVLDDASRKAERLSAELADLTCPTDDEIDEMFVVIAEFVIEF